MLRDVKASLKRKFGPLPVWAWVLITGAAIYVYRMRGVATNQSGASLDATSPDQADLSSRQDPTILQPGESAYDPNTGQLVSAAPEQQPPFEPQAPLTVDPGQTVYDPNTHTLVDPNKVKPDPKRTTKRKPKAKPHHSATKKVKHPTPVKSKPRGKGRLLAIKGRHGKGNVPGGYKARTRGAATARPSGASRVRATAARMPAMRQRPAAQHATAPHTQRIAPHPARSNEAHHAPAVHHQTKRRTKRK